MLDDHTLEIDLKKCQNLNDVFKQLSDQGVTVLSMRNKSNRLEALFVNLIDKNANKMSAQEAK
jgi:ABC-2 type transport system ATP-binding protein